MEHNNDGLIGFLSGITGAGFAAHLLNITWDTAWQNLGQLLWLGFIALFSGAMGVLGKHMVGKLIKKYTKK